MIARAASLASTILPTAARRAPSTAVRPQLTSLVDMMTILLVFLLKSFSMEGELMTTADGLHLPTSSSADRAYPEVSVEVTRAGLQLDGRHLMDLETLVALDTDTVPELLDELTQLAAVPAEAPDERSVTIQCDRDHGFRVLKRVMATCSLAGFTDFSLLVLREDG